jgi:hypothetical protein
MIGNKSHPDRERPDMFRCLQCDTTIDISGVPTGNNPSRS